MLLGKVRPSHVVLDKKRPDILMINVPVDFFYGDAGEDKFPPFGELRILAMVEKAGYVAAFLDAHRFSLSISEITEVINNLQPKLVGINPTSLNLEPAKEISKICIKANIPIIIGGVHATLDPINTIKNDFPFAFAVVRGKGEIAICQLIEDSNHNLKRPHAGIYYQEDKNSKRTDYADYVRPDELPFVDQFKYIDNPIIDRQVTINSSITNLKEVTLFVTSGCPYKCTFCASPIIIKNSSKFPYYCPPMEKIYYEIQSSIRNGANAIHFMDDMLFANPGNFIEFSRIAYKIKKHAPFFWRCMMRVSTISNDFSLNGIQFLRESGCWKMTMGIESGNQEVLDRIKKGITLDQAKNAVEKLQKSGITHLRACFIMGFPEETEEQIYDTYRFIMDLKSLGLSEVAIYQFRPYPGTEIWQDIEKNNPNILKELSYFRTPNIFNQKVVGNIYLPDNIKIAKISSGEVRMIIAKTITEFYENH